MALKVTWREYSRCVSSGEKHTAPTHVMSPPFSVRVLLQSGELEAEGPKGRLTEIQYDRVVAANTGKAPAPPSAIDNHYLAHQDDYEFSNYVEKKSSLASYITKLNAMVAEAS